MRKTCLRLVLSGLLVLSSQAAAVIGTIDDVPAATLLLPYFEVDLFDKEGVNTFLSINNASDKGVLTNVTVWTDQSVPVMTFNVYLTGYDVQLISLRSVLVNGNVPVTASAGQDPADTISPRGSYSQDINFASCSSLPPANPVLNTSTRAHIQAWLRGLQSPLTGTCAGSRIQDNILRGYITVDTVNACNLFYPASWSLYAPFITHQNVLWGEYVYVNQREGTAQGETLVHIESCTTCFFPGDHTFYGRYNGASAADKREALPTTMAVRYMSDRTWSAPSDFLVWREGNASASSYSCALQGPPSWYPLESHPIFVFNEEEQAVLVEDCSFGDPACEQAVRIRNEAQRVNVASDLFGPFDSGWVALSLQHEKLLSIYGDHNAQMWVTTALRATPYSVGFDAVQLDNANDPCQRICMVPPWCPMTCGF